MSQQAPTGMATIIPFLRYRDTSSAVEWLHRAFGFESHSILPGPDGTIVHAELRLGDGMIMLGPLKDDDLGLVSPQTAGGVTQGIYVALDTVDTHFDRARAAGAEIVRALADTGYGSREYLARDPEGHLWSFGTYRPAERFAHRV